MIVTTCPICGTQKRKREREDNGFNFCSDECKEQGQFILGFHCKNYCFVVGDYGFIVVRDEEDNMRDVFVVDKHYIWIVNCGAIHNTNGYYKSFTLGLIHRFICNVYDKNIEIDHINRLPHWNITSNLRIADRYVQNANKSIRKDNSSGVTGVRYEPRYNRYEAHISFNHEKIKLGYFETFKDAVDSRIGAEIKYFGKSNDYSNIVERDKIYNKNIKFIATSPNGTKYLHNNQKEFAVMFGLSEKQINSVLKLKQNTTKGWSFEYYNEQELNNIKNLIDISYKLGLKYKVNIPTKKCGDVIIYPVFKDCKILTRFIIDENCEDFYFTKQEIVNGSCYDVRFELDEGKFYKGRKFALGTNIYKIWLECRCSLLQYDWIYNYDKFEEFLKSVKNYSENAVNKKVCYFDPKDLIFRRVSDDSIFIKDARRQFNFIGVKDGKVYEFDNQKFVCDKYGLDSGGICRAIQSDRKSTKGWKFYKIDDYINKFGELPIDRIFDFSKEELYIDIK